MNQQPAPIPDVLAILAAMQDQLDQLAAALTHQQDVITSQQEAIEGLRRALRARDS